MSANTFNDYYHSIRKSACLFYPDVKIFEIADIDSALDKLAPVLTGRISMLEPYKLALSLMLDEQGRMEEIVYLMMFEEKFWLLTFSGDNHIEKLLKSHFPEMEEIKTVSADYKVVGLEGPYSWQILKAVFGLEVIGLSPLHFMDADLDGREVIINRYSLSGETGYRIFIKNEDADAVIQRLKEVSGPQWLEIANDTDLLKDLMDTVSVEMRIPHMNNGMINRGESPLENELRWMLRSEEDHYTGKNAVEEAAKSPVQRVVGFSFKESSAEPDLLKLIGASVMVDGLEVGRVKHIRYSPQLENHIGYISFDEDWGYVNIDEFYIDHCSGKYPVVTQSTSFLTTLSSKVELE